MAEIDGSFVGGICLHRNTNSVSSIKKYSLDGKLVILGLNLYNWLALHVPIMKFKECAHMC